MVNGGANDIAIMAAIVAFGAGYITTQQGQNALNAAMEARYLTPTEVFVFSSLTAQFFAVMSKRFLTLKKYPAVCMMFSSSSIAYIFLHYRGSFAWIVYLPPALVFFVFVIPERVHKFLSKRVYAIHRVVTGIASSCAMAIRERLGVIPDEDIPL